MNTTIDRSRMQCRTPDPVEGGGKPGVDYSEGPPADGGGGVTGVNKSEARPTADGVPTEPKPTAPVKKKPAEPATASKQEAADTKTTATTLAANYFKKSLKLAGAGLQQVTGFGASYSMGKQGGPQLTLSMGGGTMRADGQLGEFKAAGMTVKSGQVALSAGRQTGVEATAIELDDPYFKLKAGYAGLTGGNHPAPHQHGPNGKISSGVAGGEIHIRDGQDEIAVSKGFGGMSPGVPVTAVGLTVGDADGDGKPEIELTLGGDVAAGLNVRIRKEAE